MRKLELNSPAGNIECARAAVFSGADAIYIGTKLFNARRLAENFSVEEIKDIVKLAHLHNVRVFLALNTLVRNEEIPLWFEALEKAYLAGIDGVLVQEVFFVPCIRKFFPGLKVHASTQTSLMNWHGINAFNFDQVVLARELTKDGIREIRGHTKTKLEMFVHGHMCISYSGQCTISSLIGKRSGNRGICASSCRKKYNGRYLLSPKDLMLADDIDEIYNLGIDAIKIEGRMKTKEYVADATRIYRKQIDSLPNIHKISDAEASQLEVDFNREFTTGFFGGNKSIVGSMPMNRGIFLGTVKNGKLKLEADLKVGDGIGFWGNGKRRLEGFVLHKIFLNGKEADNTTKGQEISIPSRHFVEDKKVFLTSRKGVLGKENGEFLHYKVGITGRINSSLEFTINGNKIQSTALLQESKSRPLTREIIENEFRKSGQFGISLEIGQFDIAENLFLPISELTAMRRMLEDSLLHEEKRVSMKGGIQLQGREFSFKPRICVKVYSLSHLREANDAGVYAIYYDAFRDDVMQARKLCSNARFFLDTPVILNDDDINEIEGIIAKVKPDGIVIGNWGLLDIKFEGEKHGKYSLNVFNDIAICELRKKGIVPAVSAELSYRQVSTLNNREIIYYAHGRMPVMQLKGKWHDRILTDELGYGFPLRIVHGNTEMLYSRPIATFEGIRQLIRAGIRYFLLDLEKDTTTTIRAYQNLINGRKQDISMLKKGTTLGNFYKGVA